MPHAKLDTAAELEKFQVFLSLMDDALDILKQQAGQIGYSLDDSVASLAQLERFYLAAENDGLSDLDKQMLLDQAGRYLGEVLINTYGGQWRLSIANSSDAYYGQPVIVGHSIEGVEFAPLQAFQRFARQKKTGMLRAMIENQVNPQSGLEHLRPESG